MSEAMCRGCPFRKPGETRGALMLHILDDPEQTWPCHEDADRLADCAGRRLFADKVRRIRAETCPVEVRVGSCAGAESGAGS